MSFERFSNDTIVALYRIAKDRNLGAYPFFRNPKAMVALRAEVERRRGV